MHVVTFLHFLQFPTLPTYPFLISLKMNSPSVDDFAGYTMKELVALCNDNKVKGHSKKKVPEIIDMLIKAGIHPPKKEGGAAKKGRPAGVGVSAVASASTNDTKAETIAAPTTTTPAPEEAAVSNISHEYIFHANWNNVLRYLDESSVQLAIADTVRDTGVWIAESLRVLESDGVLLIRGMTTIPTLPTGARASWLPCQGNEKLLAIRKDGVTVDATMDTVHGIYNEFLEMTRPDATVLLPFAGEEVCKMVRKYRRSFIAVEANDDRLAHLYSIVQK